MKCDMKLEKRLDGFTNIYITTPKGTTIIVNPVCRKETRGKLIYKITREYIEDQENEKKEKKNKKK